jgi:glycosyltransferase involved in cell wall biosynthesis
MNQGDPADRSVHVLLIHQAFASPREAGGTRHFELGRRLVERGGCITVVASDHSYLTGKRVPLANREDVYEGVRVLRTSALGLLHRSYFWRILGFVWFMAASFGRALAARRVDVVMGTSPPLFQALSAWAVSIVRWKPFVLEIRDLWPEFAIDIGLLKSPILIWAARRLESFLYRRATHLLVNSPAYREYLVGRGLPVEKISLIPNGVDPAMFASEFGGPQLRRQWGLEDKFVVMYAGALGMANDLETLLEAAARLRDLADVRVVIVGDGKERTHLEALRDRLQLDNVIFTGAAPKDQMPAMLAMADVCTATLRDIPMFRTTYPNKVFDYMAAGRPVVLGIDGVIREVVEAAGGGVAARPGDPDSLAEAIRLLHSDREAARRMGQAGREYVCRNFNRDDQGDQFYQLMHGMNRRRAA